MNPNVLKIALLFGLFGLFMSRPVVISYIASLTPGYALLLWYILFGIFLTLLGYSVLQGRWNLRYTFASLMVMWAIGIILYYPVSEYSWNITGAHLTGIESATEDAVTYSFLTHTIGLDDSAGLLTYVFIPVILILIAGYVVAPRLFNQILRMGLRG